MLWIQERTPKQCPREGHLELRRQAWHHPAPCCLHGLHAGHLLLEMNLFQGVPLRWEAVFSPVTKDLVTSHESEKIGCVIKGNSYKTFYKFKWQQDFSFDKFYPNMLTISGSGSFLWAENGVGGAEEVWKITHSYTEKIRSAQSRKYLLLSDPLWKKSADSCYRV